MGSYDTNSPPPPPSLVTPAISQFLPTAIPLHLHLFAISTHRHPLLPTSTSNKFKISINNKDYIKSDLLAIAEPHHLTVAAFIAAFIAAVIAAVIAAIVTAI